VGWRGRRGAGREIRMRVLVSRTGFGERRGGTNAARQFNGRVLARTCILYIIVRYGQIQIQGVRLVFLTISFSSDVSP
jgi:hypothetical protein